MAICAFIGGFRVIDRLALGHAVVVAADTSDRCSLENTTLVACFAGDSDVLAFKRKARGLVIEILVNLDADARCRRCRLSLRCGRQGDQRQDKPKARDKSHEAAQTNLCSAAQILSNWFRKTSPFKVALDLHTESENAVCPRRRIAAPNHSTLLTYEELISHPLTGT